MRIFKKCKSWYSWDIKRLLLCHATFFFTLCGPILVLRWNTYSEDVVLALQGEGLPSEDEGDGRQAGDLVTVDLILSKESLD